MIPPSHTRSHGVARHLLQFHQTPPAQVHAPTSTVVVPTRNAERTLEACLRSLRAQQEPCIVVVVDNHSTDGTLAIARSLADIVDISGPERSAQRNAGARLATTPVVGFVDADMVLSPEVTSQAVRILSGSAEDGPVAVVVPERSFGQGFWADVRAFERSFYGGVDTVEAARFFRRDVVERVGGFDESMPVGGEDWDLTQRVRKRGTVVRIEAWIDHDEGSPGYIGLCRKKAYYAAGLRAYVSRYGFSSISIVDRPYIRRPWLVWGRGWRLGTGLVALKAGEATAVGIGMWRRRATRL